VILFRRASEGRQSFRCSKPIREVSAKWPLVIFPFHLPNRASIPNKFSVSATAPHAARRPVSHVLPLAPRDGAAAHIHNTNKGEIICHFWTKIGA